jgi:hypothetical protein
MMDATDRDCALEPREHVGGASDSFHDTHLAQQTVLQNVSVSFTAVRHPCVHLTKSPSLLAAPHLTQKHTPGSVRAFRHNIV